jgi:hypothetical protein
MRRLAQRSRGWLTATFTAGAVALTSLPPSSAPQPPGHGARTFSLPPANDNFCLADINDANIRAVTGFGDVEALRQGSALITQMNGRNGTPVAVLAILEASDATGVSFEIMIAKAIVESRLGVYDKPIGVNGSARGVFQFMPATWLSVFSAHAALYKNGKYAALAQEVQFDRKGVPYVTDKDKEREILELRSDPYVASFLKAVYLRDVETPQLQKLLGRAPQAVDFYMLHLLGLPRTTTFFNKLEKTPNAAARTTFRREARYNRGVFYNSKGRARTYQQVYEHLGALMQNYIDLVQKAGTDAEKDGACVTPLRAGQTPPPAAPLPAEPAAAEPPPPAANDNDVALPDGKDIPVPMPNPRRPGPAPAP